MRDRNGWMGASVLALAMLFAGSPAGAADAENGKELHDGRCMRGCHTTDLYTSPDRKRNTFKELHRQVEICNNQAPGDPWFDDEVEDVFTWLNQTFYKVK